MCKEENLRAVADAETRVRAECLEDAEKQVDEVLDELVERVRAEIMDENAKILNEVIKRVRAECEEENAKVVAEAEARVGSESWKPKRRR